MTNAAGVAGIIHPRREVISDTTVTSRDEKSLAVREVRGFLQSDHVIFLALKLVHILLGIAVAKLDERAIWELEHLLALNVFRNAVEIVEQREDMVPFQFSKRAAEK